MNLDQLKLVLETALLCAEQPMTLNDLRRLFVDEITTEELQQALTEIQVAWTDKGMELLELATGWRFQSRLAMREFLDRLTPEKPPKYSRAVMETLAIIAYRQPVTRGEIEEGPALVVPHLRPAPADQRQRSPGVVLHHVRVVEIGRAGADDVLVHGSERRWEMADGRWGRVACLPFMLPSFRLPIATSWGLSL